VTQQNCTQVSKDSAAILCICSAEAAWMLNLGYASHHPVSLHGPDAGKTESNREHGKDKYRHYSTHNPGLK